MTFIKRAQGKTKLAIFLLRSLALATEIPHNAVRDLNVFPLPVFSLEAGILPKTIEDTSRANPKRIGLKATNWTDYSTTSGVRITHSHITALLNGVLIYVNTYLFM